MTAHFQTAIHTSSKLSTGLGQLAAAHKRRLRTFKDKVLYNILQLRLMGVEFSHQVENRYQVFMTQ